MLGNDLVGLHHPKQTIQNLKFTLEYEPDFPHTDKVFVLNRIFDVYKQRKIIALLKKYNKKFIIFNGRSPILLSPKERVLKTIVFNEKILYIFK